MKKKILLSASFLLLSGCSVFEKTQYTDNLHDYHQYKCNKEISYSPENVYSVNVRLDIKEPLFWFMYKDLNTYHYSFNLPHNELFFYYENEFFKERLNNKVDIYNSNNSITYDNYKYTATMSDFYNDISVKSKIVNDKNNNLYLYFFVYNESNEKDNSYPNNDVYKFFKYENMFELANSEKLYDSYTSYSYGKEKIINIDIDVCLLN